MAITKVPSKKQGFTYQVDFRFKDALGVTQRIVKSGFKSQKEAKSFLKNEQEKIAVESIKECNKTFDEVFCEYMEVEGRVKYANASKVYYLTTHDRYIKNKFGRTPITAVKYINLQKEFKKLSEKYNYPTLKNIRKVFSVTLAYAEKAGYVKCNPVPQTRLPKNPVVERVIVETISNEDLRRLIDLILTPNKYNPHPVENAFKSNSYAMALFIGRYTGLRVSEALALKKSDFDLENNTLTVQRRVEYAGLHKKDIYLTETMKSPKSKATVEISRGLSGYLKQWFEVNPHDLVICDNEGEMIPPETFNMKIRTSAKKLGVHFHYHMLRHTYATELMMAGINPIVVKDLLRHSEVNTTWSIYTHPKSEDQREALDQLYMKM